MESVSDNWKKRFIVLCKNCRNEADIMVHLSTDDTDSYYGQIYFKCPHCPSERVYAESSADVIFDFLDLE